MRQGPTLVVAVVISSVILVTMTAAKREPTFVVYDNMFYKDKPNTALHGLLPSNILHERAIWPDGNRNELPDRHAYEELVRANNRNSGPFVIDIEDFPLRDPPQLAQRNLEMLAKLADWTRHAVHRQAVGFYGTHTLTKVPPAYWKEARQLARHVDAFFPPMYTFDDDRHKWQMKAEAEAKEAHELDPKKPIYFYLWPQYHDHTPKQFAYVDESYWQFQLKTAYRLSDRIVIWGPSRFEWNDRTGWWAATLKFVGSLSQRS